MMPRAADRRSLASSIALLGVVFVLAAIIAPACAEPITVTDITGRTVTLAQPAKRMILAEGRQILGLSLLLPDPVSPIAGWLGDFRRNDSESYALYRQKFPAIDDIPVLGMGNDGSFSVEKAIALKPDVAVLGTSFAPSGRGNDVARQLEAVGIPVVFTDFFVNPFDNTIPSMRVLGRVTGRDPQAEDYIAFYEAHMKRIAQRMPKDRMRPSVLFETHANLNDCCHAPGAGNIGRFISFVGGESISAAVSKGPTAQLGLEYVIEQNPDVYVGTGGAHLKATGGLVIGPGFDSEAVQQRLAAVVARPGFAELRAIKEKRVHGLFHNIMSTPLNLLATEALARWLHPDAMRDIDPDATMAEINAKFLAVPMKGIYWVDLK